MTELEQDISDWVEKSAAQALEDRGRERVQESLYNWLAFTARKKPDVDLAKRLEDFRKRIEVLAENLEVGVGPAGYVVRATGEAETTLRMLEHGTNWFDPAGNLTEMIVGAVFEQRS